MFICYDCKEKFDYPEIREWDEPRGEFWGAPCSEHMVEWHCPVCGSEDVEEYYGDDDEEEEDE